MGANLTLAVRYATPSPFHAQCGPCCDRRSSMYNRNLEKGNAAKEDLLNSVKNAVGSIDVLHLDNSELQSVRQFVKAYGDRKVDILINSAGAASTTVCKTKDGLELTFESNFLAHFALTLMLLPNLNQNARIVNMSSQGQYSASRDMFKLDDMDWSKALAQKGYAEGQQMPQSVTLSVYARTKLCQIFHTSELERRLGQSDTYKDKNILCKSCHPGVIGSSIWGNLGSGFSAKLTTFWASTVGITPEQGACTPTWLAVTPDLHRGGMYYERQQERVPNALALDAKLKEEHWDLWCDACDLKGIL